MPPPSRRRPQESAGTRWWTGPHAPVSASPFSTQPGDVHAHDAHLASPALSLADDAYVHPPLSLDHASPRPPKQVKPAGPGHDAVSPGGILVKHPPGLLGSRQLAQAPRLPGSPGAHGGDEATHLVVDRSLRKKGADGGRRRRFRRLAPGRYLVARPAHNPHGGRSRVSAIAPITALRRSPSRLTAS